MKRTRKYYLFALLGTISMVILAGAASFKIGWFWAMSLTDLSVLLFVMAGYQLGARTNKETYESRDLSKMFKSRSDNENPKDNG